MYRSIPFIAILFICITSCKKKNEQKSKATLLTQKVWFVSKFEIRVNNNPYVDQYPSWRPCDQDDEQIFYANYTTELNQGKLKCNPGAPQIIGTETWLLIENDTKIVFNQYTWSLEQLTEDLLIMNYTGVLFPNQTNSTRISYRH